MGDKEKKELLTDVGKLVLGNKIGHGGFADVYQALHVDVGRMVAVKEMRLSSATRDAQNSLMTEINLLKKLQHKHIVSYITFIQTKDYLYIAMEFVESGSLLHMIQKFGTLPESLVAIYIGQVLDGLAYLHDQGVIHRDIKAANILVTKDGNVKIADFGVAAAELGINATEGVLGTPYWMAPEVVEMSGVTTKSDIWSVACTVIELVTGSPPYFNLPQMSALFHIVQDESPPIPDDASLSQTCVDWLTFAFKKDPLQRWPATKLSKHKWILDSKKKTKENENENKEIVSPKSIEDSFTKLTLNDSPKIQRNESNVSEKILKKPAISPKATLALNVQAKKSVDEDMNEDWDDDFGENGKQTLKDSTDVVAERKIPSVMNIFSANSSQSKLNLVSSQVNSKKGKADEEFWDDDFGDMDTLNPPKLNQPNNRKTGTRKSSTSRPIPRKPTKKTVVKENENEAWDDDFGSDSNIPTKPSTEPTFEKAPVLNARLSPSKSSTTKKKEAFKGPSSWNDGGSHKHRIRKENGIKNSGSLTTVIPSRVFEDDFKKDFDEQKKASSKKETPSNWNAGNALPRNISKKTLDEDFEKDLNFDEHKKASPSIALSKSETENIEATGLSCELALTLVPTTKKVDWDELEAAEDEEDPFSDIFDDDVVDDDVLREKREQQDVITKSTVRAITLLDSIAKIDMSKKEAKSEELNETVIKTFNDLEMIFSKGLEISNDQDNKSKDAKKIILMLRKEDKRKLVRQYGAAKLLDALEVASKREQWIAPCVRTLSAFLDSSELIVIFCVIGILSRVLSLSRRTLKGMKNNTITHTQLSILVAVSQFVKIFCQNKNTIVSQMFIACNGLSTLISLLSIDESIKTSDVKLAEAARELTEKILLEIAEIASHPDAFGSNRGDLCRLLIHGQVLVPLLQHLSRVCIPQHGEHPHCATVSHRRTFSRSPSGKTANGPCAKCEALSSKIFSVLLLLSSGDTAVKKSLCNEKILRTFKEICPLLSSHSRLSLLKIFCNLSSDPLIQSTLIENGFIQFLNEMIANKNITDPKELTNLLLTLNYCCGYDQSRYAMIVKSGIVPSLIFHSESKSTYRELAITVFLRLCLSTESVSTFVQCGAVDFLVNISKTSQFTTIAIERLALFCSIDSKVAQSLMSDPNKVTVLGSLITNSEPSTLGTIASSLHNLFSKYSELAFKVAAQRNVLAFVVDKITRNALRSEFKVSVAELLIDLISGLLKEMQQKKSSNVRVVVESSFALFEPLRKALESTASLHILNSKIKNCIDLLENATKLLEDNTKSKKQLNEDKKKRESNEKKHKKEKEKDKKIKRKIHKQ